MLQPSVLKRERKLYGVLGAESSYIYAESLYRLTTIELACSTKLLVHVTKSGDNDMLFDHIEVNNEY